MKTIEELKAEMGPELLEIAEALINCKRDVVDRVNSVGASINWLYDFYYDSPPRPSLTCSRGRVALTISIHWLLKEDIEKVKAVLNQEIRYVWYEVERLKLICEHHQKTLTRFQENKERLSEKLSHKVKRWEQRGYKPAGIPKAWSA